MAKSKNIAKAASATVQSEQAIRKAIKNAEPGAWMSVQKRLGNGYFTLQDYRGHLCRGTPRGLFTKGTMPISTGQVVVVSGNPAIGVEIIGVFPELRDAEQLSRSGVIPAEVVRAAKSYGLESVKEEEDYFEAMAEEAEEAEGSKADQEARRAVQARVESLLGGAGGYKASDVKIDEDVNVDDI
jgi:hypothetical protein